jgi:hypothetical protein
MITITEKRYNGWRDTIFEGEPEAVVLHVAKLLATRELDSTETRAAIAEVDRCRRTALRIVVAEIDDPNQLNLI